MIRSRLSSQLLFDPALHLFAPQLPISDLLTQPSAHSFLLLWPSRRHHLIQAIDVHDIAHMRRSDGYAVEIGYAVVAAGRGVSGTEDQNRHLNTRWQ